MANDGSGCHPSRGKEKTATDLVEGKLLGGRFNCMHNFLKRSVFLSFDKATFIMDGLKFENLKKLYYSLCIYGIH